MGSWEYYGVNESEIIEGFSSKEPGELMWILKDYSSCQAMQRQAQEVNLRGN